MLSGLRTIKSHLRGYEMSDVVRNSFANDRRCNRGSNNRHSTKLLIDNGIKFKSKYNGTYLIVDGIAGNIEFWPGTGKYKAKNGEHGRGVFNLMKLCNKKPLQN